MANIVFTKREKRILLLVKSFYAFAWGFLNSITYLTSSRYATMMTGNLILLAVQTKEWMVEEMVLTITLIVAYIAGGTIYDILATFVKDKNKVLAITVGIVLIMGTLADILQYTIRISSGVVSIYSSENDCVGHLYYLTPLAVLSGIVTSGHLKTHFDGVVSSLMTGHMTVGPNSLIKLYLGKKPDATDRILLWHKARLSSVMIAMFFVGVLVGDLAEDGIRKRVHQFTPVFTSFGVFLAILCTCHSKLCDRFIQLEEEKRKAMRVKERATVFGPAAAAMMRVDSDEISESDSGEEFDKS